MNFALNIERLGARFGGAEKYAGTVARWLIDAGHHVHVFATEVAAAELPAGTTVQPVRPWCPPGMGWLRTYLFARASEAALRQHRFDLIIGFNKVWYVDAYLALGGAHPAALDHNSRRFRTPFMRALWWSAKWLSPKQWVFRAIAHKQFADRHSPYVIAPAQLVADHFADYHGVAPDRVIVVYNALDSWSTPADPCAARSRFRRRLGFSSCDVAILFVARNYVLKGLDPLLRAFAPVANAHPCARLVVCGSPREVRFQKLARRLGIADRVSFLGFVDDVRDCFAGSDLFAFPTFYDPCSLVVLEAMNAGLPVITTRQNGAGELLTEGEDGYVIESPWSLDQLTHRLSLLVCNSELRHRMSVQARVNVRAYTVEARRHELLAALERAAADPRPPKFKQAA